jgi:hypothetical protein
MAGSGSRQKNSPFKEFEELRMVRAFRAFRVRSVSGREVSGNEYDSDIVVLLRCPAVRV